MRELLAVEREGDLLRAVAAEVEENDAVAVCDLRDGLAIVGDDERQKVLVDHAGVFGAVGLDGFLGGGELTALALHVRAPALFDHRPVGFIAVHRDDHAAAAGSDLVFMRRIRKLGKYSFQLVDILERARCGHIAAIEKNVAVDALHVLCARLLEHGDEVRDVGVDVAVGKQTEEMQRLVVFLAVGNERLPGLRLIQRAGFNGLADELCALGVDLAAAERVVANLGVAHVVVGGKADGRAVRLEPRHGARGHQLVKIRRVRLLYRVAGAAIAATNAVHNHQYDRFFHLYILHIGFILLVSFCSCLFYTISLAFTMSIFRLQA